MKRILALIALVPTMALANTGTHNNTHNHYYENHYTTKWIKAHPAKPAQKQAQQQDQTQAVDNTVAVSGDSMGDIPVASAAVLTGGECTQIINGQTYNLGIGFTNRDATCAWQGLTDEERKDIVMFRCDTPPTGKGTDTRANAAFESCLRNQAESRAMEKRLKVQARREQCAIGVLEWVGKVLFTGLAKCPAELTAWPEQK